MNFSNIIQKFKKKKNAPGSDTPTPDEGQEGEEKTPKSPPSSPPSDKKNNKKKKILQIVIALLVIWLIADEFLAPPPKAPESEEEKDPQQQVAKSQDPQEDIPPDPNPAPVEEPEVPPPAPDPAPIEEPEAPPPPIQEEPPPPAPDPAPVEEPETPPPIQEPETPSPIQEEPPPPAPDPAPVEEPEVPPPAQEEPPPPAEEPEEKAPTLGEQQSPDQTGDHLEDILKSPIQETQVEKQLGSSVEILKSLKIDPKKTYAPPDYELKGRGLVYDCLKKRWACVDRIGYFQCARNLKSSRLKSKPPACLPKDIYFSHLHCARGQLEKIHTGKGPQKCSN